MPRRSGRPVLIGTVMLMVLGALFVAQSTLGAFARARSVDAPRFEVDPLWPKPLPNHWVLGNVIGVGVDANDHVFIVHRNDTFDREKEIGAVATPKLSESCWVVLASVAAMLASASPTSAYTSVPRLVYWNDEKNPKANACAAITHSGVRGPTSAKSTISNPRPMVLESSTVR